MERKYNLLPVVSPFNPDRLPTIPVRVASGACQMCGALGDWKCFDVYARVEFVVRTDVGGALEPLMPSLRKALAYTFDRYIGRLPLLLCDSCVTRRDYEQWLKRERTAFAIRIWIIMAIAILLACGTWACRSQIGFSLFLGFWLVVALSCLPVLMKSYRSYGEPEKRELDFYRSRVTELLLTERSKTIEACNFAGIQLCMRVPGSKRVYREVATEHNIKLEVEPDAVPLIEAAEKFNQLSKNQRSRYISRGDDGFEWRTQVHFTDYTAR
jgi:hypothetical protein